MLLKKKICLNGKILKHLCKEKKSGLLENLELSTTLLQAITVGQGSRKNVKDENNLRTHATFEEAE